MAWAAVIGAGGAILGGVMANKSNKDSIAAQEKANQGDPRKNAMLYGSNGNNGLLNQYQQLGQAPQDQRLANYGGANLNYLGGAPGDLNQIRSTASGLASGATVPKVQATGQQNVAYMHGAQVQAPSQNGMDLNPAFNRVINGDAGSNPYLTRALQGGIDQSTNQFQQMQGMATDNLQRNILPGIRSNAVLAGGYGGSRQGIAEGNAIGDFSKAQQQSISQFGQNNTNAAVGAQAQAFNQGQDRSLSALMGLSGQQYNVASQDAGYRNAADSMNVNRTNDIAANWAARDQQAQTANQAAAIQGQTIGAGLLGGQMSNAYGVGQNQDNYALNRAGMTNSLLQPYLGNNPAQQVAPQSNVAGSALGGATAGLGLLNKFNQANKPPTVGNYSGAQGTVGIGGMSMNVNDLSGWIPKN